MPTQEEQRIRLTKNIDAYVVEVSLAWGVYVELKEKGTEEIRAERAALRSVYSGSNAVAPLKTWKKHKFWPKDAAEEIRKTREISEVFVSQGVEQERAESEAVKTVLKDYPHALEALQIWKKCRVWSEEPPRHAKDSREKPSTVPPRSGLLFGGARMTDKDDSHETPKSSQDIPGMSQAASVLTEDELMAHLRELLSQIDIDERKWWGKATGKAPEGEKLKPIGGKVSPEVVAQVKRLRGAISHHLEKALKLYLMVLRSAQR